jgi:hypothetical protein
VIAALVTFAALIGALAAIRWFTRVTDAKQMLDWWDEDQGR